jgi:DNA-binding XRE family transcriptional regulator
LAISKASHFSFVHCINRTFVVLKIKVSPQMIICFSILALFHLKISTTKLAISICNYTKAKSEPVERKAHNIQTLPIPIDTIFAISPIIISRLTKKTCKKFIDVRLVQVLHHHLPQIFNYMKPASERNRNFIKVISDKLKYHSRKILHGKNRSCR